MDHLHVGSPGSERTHPGVVHDSRLPPQRESIQSGHYTGRSSRRRRRTPSLGLLSGRLHSHPARGPRKRPCVQPAPPLDRPHLWLPAARPGCRAGPQRVLLPHLRRMCGHLSDRRPGHAPRHRAPDRPLWTVSPAALHSTASDKGRRPAQSPLTTPSLPHAARRSGPCPVATHQCCCPGTRQQRGPRQVHLSPKGGTPHCCTPSREWGRCGRRPERCGGGAPLATV
mmetsp:Transcript_3242/g.9404  ORF Transcript_3242/g.9404 Transcript_3242/m.9404 type:complete len:226 (+) Transcript_3242:1879-2556(+)